MKATLRIEVTPADLQKLESRMRGAAPDCPGDDALLAYACSEPQTSSESSTIDDELVRIEKHLDGCSSCREWIDRWRADLERVERQQGGEAFEAFQRRLARRPLGQPGPAEDPAHQSWQRLDGWRSSSGAYRGVVLAQTLAIVVLALSVAVIVARQENRPASELVALGDASLLRAEMREGIRALDAARATLDGGGDVTAAAASIRRINLVQPAILETDPGLRVEYDEYARKFTDEALPLSAVLVQTGMVKQARAVFAYLRSRYPDDVRYWFAEAEMCKLDQDHVAAIELYRDMIQRGMAKGDPRPYHFAGYSFFVMRDFDQALDYYNQAIAISRNYAKVYFNLAELYRQRQDLDPRERERLYAENFQRAFDLTVKAHGVEGDANPRITFTLAILHAVRGLGDDRDRALDFLERAILAERSYLTRAQADAAFVYFREPRNEPYYSRFRNLIGRYRVRTDQFGAHQGAFDPNVFVE